MAAHDATGATNSEEEEVERCAICIHDIAPGSVAQVVPCLHYYCLPCIQSWAKTKLSCPLCTGPFTSVKHFSDTKNKLAFELVTFEEPAPQEPVRDFSCLDFDFFLSLATRVLTNISDAESILFTSNGVFSARSGVIANTARTVLGIFRERVNQIITSLLEETHFSPEVLLDEISLMDKNMQILWTGKIPQGVIPEEPFEYYSEEDEEEDLEYDYRYDRDHPVDNTSRVPVSYYKKHR